jgi:hypothetical protein
MADIFLSWEDIVGTLYARSTFPLRLQSSSGGQFTLHVQVSREQALEVRYNAPKLIARLNQYFGGALIQALTLRITDAMAQRPEDDSMLTDNASKDGTTTIMKENEVSLETLLSRLGGHLQD